MMRTRQQTRRRDWEAVAGQNLMQWVRLQQRRDERLRWFHHIPNGGKRGIAEARIFKGMGTRAGVADYFLPAPAGGYHGLYIELKADPSVSGRKSYPSREQRAFLAHVEAQGYAAAVCYGWREAARRLIDYLGLEAEA